MKVYKKDAYNIAFTNAFFPLVLSVPFVSPLCYEFRLAIVMCILHLKYDNIRVYMVLKIVS